MHSDDNNHIPSPKPPRKTKQSNPNNNTSQEKKSTNLTNVGIRFSDLKASVTSPDAEIVPNSKSKNANAKIYSHLYFAFAFFYLWFIQSNSPFFNQN